MTTSHGQFGVAGRGELSFTFGGMKMHPANLDGNIDVVREYNVINDTWTDLTATLDGIGGSYVASISPTKVVVLMIGWLGDRRGDVRMFDLISKEFGPLIVTGDLSVGGEANGYYCKGPFTHGEFSRTTLPPSYFL